MQNFGGFFVANLKPLNKQSSWQWRMTFTSGYSNVTTLVWVNHGLVLCVGWLGIVLINFALDWCPSYLVPTATYLGAVVRVTCACIPSGIAVSSATAQHLVTCCTQNIYAQVYEYSHMDIVCIPTLPKRADISNDEYACTNYTRMAISETHHRI